MRRSAPGPAVASCSASTTQTPWCRYYVLASDEPDRRYRELDVGCDPWGIGKDGPALQVALAHAVDEGGLRVPAPAAQTLYLAIKKARKHRDGEADRKVLLDAFDRDPRGSSELLVRHLGRPGDDLARALEARQQTIEHELEGVRRSLRRRWASPFKLARRVGFGTRRIVGRTLRPTGLVVHINRSGRSGEIDARRPTRETGDSRRPLPSLRSLPPPARPPSASCAPASSRAFERRDASREGAVRSGRIAAAARVPVAGHAHRLGPEDRGAAVRSGWSWSSAAGSIWPWIPPGIGCRHRQR